MAVRRLDKSWQYDFTLEGHGRRRKAGFRTKAEAREAERRKREELISGQKGFHMADAYRMYLSATTMKPGSRDNCTRFWRDFEPQIGHKSAKSTHQYAHLGQRAQLRLVADLKPSAPPHVNVRSTSERR